MHNSWKCLFEYIFVRSFRQESTKLPTKKSVSPVQNHSPTGVTAHQIHSFFHATSAPRTFPGQQMGNRATVWLECNKNSRMMVKHGRLHSSIVLKNILKWIYCLNLFSYIIYNKKKDALGILSCCVCEKGGCFGTQCSETQQQNQIDWAFKLVINIPDKSALLWLNQYMALKILMGS